mmetsp:Transcript_63026/g.153507  ORF Transcript_63026/g.153507 Transcript_63026/m.153507 type:complete len:786 (+) Transcript_63026:249-2606(+)
MNETKVDHNFIVLVVSCMHKANGCDNIIHQYQIIMNSSGTSTRMELMEQPTVAIHQQEDQEMIDLHCSSPSPVNDPAAEEEDDLTIQWDVTTMSATDAAVAATSSGVDTSSNTASSSLPLQHLPTHNLKTQHQARSASQPRAPTVQVANQDTSRLLIHKNQRSTSQPRAATLGSFPSSVQQKQHFLQGYNMGSHRLDVRSIPDPPTPLPPQIRSHNSRRRTSLSTHHYMMSSSTTAAGGKVSLEDVTNQGLAMGFTLNNTSAAVSTNDSETQKKRKTMFLIPSSSSSSSDFERQSQQLCLAGDDGDGEEHEDGSPPKRRKRRQSMVLPIKVDASDADSSPSQTSRDQQKTKPSSLMLFNGDSASMRELQTLVRNYCAKPNSERDGSQEVATIRQLTGYALSGSTANRDLNEDKNQGAIHQGRQSKSTVLLASSRRLVMEKLGPVMAEMERRKVEDKQKWEHVTGCRVAKSQRSGKYRYFCTASNMKVSSQEYKGRYMSILEQEKPDRESKAQAWKGLLTQPSVDGTANGFDDEMSRSDCGPSGPHPDHEGKIIADAVAPQVTHSVSSDQQGPSPDMFSENSEIVPDEYVQREAFLPPRNETGSRKELAEPSIFPVSTHTDCERSSILPIAATVSNSDFDESSDISRAASGESDDSQNDTMPPLLADDKLVIDSDRDSVTTDASGPGNFILLDPGSLLHSEDTEATLECSDAEGETSAMSDPHELESDEVPLLPIPSRDDTSADPKIAMAEKRLWDKIDEALREYSQEVTEIKSGKSGTTGGPIAA